MCSSQEHFGNPIKAINRTFHPERYRNGWNILPKDLYDPPKAHQAEDERNCQGCTDYGDQFEHLFISSLGEKHSSCHSVDLPIVRQIQVVIIGEPGTNEVRHYKMQGRAILGDFKL